MKKVLTIIKSPLIFFLILQFVIAASGLLIYLNPTSANDYIGLMILSSTVLSWIVFYFSFKMPIQSIQKLSRKINRLTSSLSLEIQHSNPQNNLEQIGLSFEKLASHIIEQGNDLEHKIVERTLHLNNSLQEVTNLKFQQDGDYFLTAQLLKPLNGNHAKSKTCSIDFFIEQKKKFHFKKWNEEIGGDICITESLELYGNIYTFVMNADAMGKSIQGAGGILVLGSIINANLERTKKSSQVKQQSPERWLKNCFLELQSVFESFEDMMYISMIISLIEDKTGTMYYINADHPSMVLSRGLNVRFIKEKTKLMKIGMISSYSRLQISCLLLKNKDEIFIGSDGKDDIITGLDTKGHKIINDDDNLFIQYIQLNKGSLHGIIQSIKSSGELMDDISLIKIQYSNSPDPVISKEAMEYLIQSNQEKKARNIEKALEFIDKALTLQPALPSFLKRKARLLNLQNDYIHSSSTAIKYFQLKPSDTGFMNFLAKTMEKSGQIIESIEMRERFLMRRPNNIDNLENLSRLYRANGNPARASVLMAERNKISNSYKKL